MATPSKKGGVILPERLDSGAYGGLRTLLLKVLRRKTPQYFDGSQVMYLGALCLELLLASKIKIKYPSENLLDALKLFGVTNILIEKE